MSPLNLDLEIRDREEVRDVKHERHERAYGRGHMTGNYE